MPTCAHVILRGKFKGQYCPNEPLINCALCPHHFEMHRRIAPYKGKLELITVEHFDFKISYVVERKTICTEEPATVYMNGEQICQLGHEELQKLYLRGVLENNEMREATSDEKTWAKVLYIN